MPSVTRTHPLWISLLLISAIQAAHAQQEENDTAISLDTLQVTDKTQQQEKTDLSFADDGPQTFDEWKEKARKQTADLGPLGDRNILDLPYELNTVSYSMIRNQQIKNMHDALRYIPSVQGDGTRPQARGMQGSVIQNFRIDGFNAVSTTEYPIEQFDRIEIMNGLAGSLYGPANPAGTFNSVSKRPTGETRNRITAGLSTGLSYLKAADLSGAIPGLGNRIRYRVNLMDDRGQGYTHDSRVSRTLGSLALDFQLSDRTVLETNASHYEYRSRGLPGTVALSTSMPLPAAIDPNQKKYGQHWAGDRQHTATYDFHLKHDFDGNWKMDVGALRQIADRDATDITYTLVDRSGDYKSGVKTSAASRFTVTSYLGNLNGHVRTGFMDHNLSFGVSGFVWNNYNPKNGSAVSSGTTSTIDYTGLAGGNYNDPTLVSKPGFLSGFHDRYRTSKATQTSLIMGDSITLSPHWIVSGTASWSRFTTKNWGAVKENGVYVTSKKKNYSENYGWNQAASLTYKPTDSTSIYLTYADSLQQGDTSTAGSNYNEILSPYRSRQWELGAKAVVGGARLSLAVYQIKRPYQGLSTTDNLYENIGEQRNRGVELTIDGKPTENLYLFGGISWLEAKLRHTGDKSTNGKLIVGLPRYTANLLTEYTIPGMQGLAVNLNARYVGRQATDIQNQYWYGDYHLFDMGARYSTQIMHRNTVLRLQVTNLTDRRYWTNIHPGGLNGYGSSGYASATAGTPRMFSASVQVDL